MEVSFDSEVHGNVAIKGGKACIKVYVQDKEILSLTECEAKQVAESIKLLLK